MAKIFTEVIRSIQSRPQNASILLRKIIPNYAYGKNICKKLLKTGTQNQRVNINTTSSYLSKWKNIQKSFILPIWFLNTEVIPKWNGL